MPNILIDYKTDSEQARRERLFDGDIFVDHSRLETRELCGFANDLITEAFQTRDPERVQHQIKVEEFISIAGPLKSRFTNHPHTKVLIQKILSGMGCDLNKTYFDVPRLRVATSGGYLSAGVGYAYKAHRDTWYSSPQQQINWWLPIFDLEAGRSLILYPSHWTRPIRNTSAGFDYDEWCQVGRQLATSQVKTDSRKHPVPEEELAFGDESRIVCAAGSCIAFAGAHLHATAPNDTGLTRFSLDFRTVHVDDLIQQRGAPNIDCAATGTTLRDFLRTADLEPLPNDIVAMYNRRPVSRAA